MFIIIIRFLFLPLPLTKGKDEGRPGCKNKKSGFKPSSIFSSRFCNGSSMGAGEMAGESVLPRSKI